MDYFLGSHNMHCDFPLMSTIGNNDMVRKTDSFAYTYYFNTENNASVDGKQVVSCHEWEIGDCWFCCLNSNEDFELQREWFIERVRATTKKWKIVYTHDAPYTITKLVPGTADSNDKIPVTGVYRNDSKLFKEFARLFEAYGVHLVLCGHKHNYCRSRPVFNTYAVVDSNINPDRIKNEPRRAPGSTWRVPVWVNENEPDPEDPEKPYIDIEKGVVYCMSNATGYKLKSNKDLPWTDWYYAHVQRDDPEKYPQYTMWTVTPEKITVKSYQIYNIKQIEDHLGNGLPFKHQFDGVGVKGGEIPYQNKHYRDLAYVGQIIPSVTVAEIPAGENRAIITVRLSVAPTTEQIVNFSINSAGITLSGIPTQSPDGTPTPPIFENNQITFRYDDYYVERRIAINKDEGASSGTLMISMSTPQDPEISAVVTPQIVTVNIL